MSFLSEDPTYLAGGLGLLGLLFLVLLRTTQQGKYLIWAGVALGLAAGVLVIERLWVTDNERVEAVVYDMARAVERSDPDGVIAHLTDDATVELGELSGYEGAAKRYLLAVLSRFGGVRLKMVLPLFRRELESIKFDTLYVGHLTTHVGEQSRLGTATFRVYASGTHVDPQGGITYTFVTPTSGTDWSLGFREVAPKVWKVERISPTSVPVDSEVLAKDGFRRPR